MSSSIPETQIDYEQQNDQQSEKVIANEEEVILEFVKKKPNYTGVKAADHPIRSKFSFKKKGEVLFAFCKEERCITNISCAKGINNGNLMRHYRTYHLKAHEELIKVESDKKLPNGLDKQPKIAESFARGKQINLSSLQVQKLKKSLALSCISKILPFTGFESHKDTLEAIGVATKPAWFNRKTIRKEALELATQQKHVMQKRRSEFLYCSRTMDAWTTRMIKESYLAINEIGITKQWQLKAICTSVNCSYKSGSNESYSDWLHNDAISCKCEQLHCNHVVDGGGDMRKGINDAVEKAQNNGTVLNLKVIPCVTHSLQRVIINSNNGKVVKTLFDVKSFDDSDATVAEPKIDCAMCNEKLYRMLDLMQYMDNNELSEEDIELLNSSEYCKEHVSFGEELNNCKESTIASVIKRSKVLVGLLGKSRKINNRMHELAKEKFNIEDGTEFIGVVKSSATRWSALFLMIDRLLKMKQMIDLVMVEYSRSNIQKDKVMTEKNLTTEEWKILNDMKKLLHPFQIATDTLQGDMNVTSSLIIPTIAGLFDQTFNCDVGCYATRNYKLLLVRNLQRRFQFLYLSPRQYFPEFNDDQKHVFKTWWSACVLDPTLKGLPWDDQYDKLFIDAIKPSHSDYTKMHDEVLSVIAEECVAFTEKCGNHNIDLTTPTQIIQPTILANKNGYQGIHARKRKRISSSPTRVPSGSVKQKVQRELLQYFTPVASAPEGVTCLEWWHENAMHYPIISEFAASVLCVPASQAITERLFSIGNRLVSNERTGLHPQLVCTLLQASGNIQYASRT